MDKGTRDKGQGIRGEGVVLSRKTFLTGGLNVLPTIVKLEGLSDFLFSCRKDI